VSLHDDLLRALRGNAAVELVACLRDERLGFPQAHELHVFIPDVHLITAARRAESGYAYTTNFPGLLENVVVSLKDLRRDSAATGAGEVVVYQLGDLFDLWRQVDGLDPQAIVASAIQNDHLSLLRALRDPELNTQFVLGNHDYDLFRFPSFDAWQRSFILPPSALVLHGDVFDWVEAALPDELKNLFLYLFSVSHPAGKAEIKKLRPLNRRSRAGNRFRTFIRSQDPARTGTWPPQDGIPPYFNVQVEGVAPPAMLTFLDQARRKCAAEFKIAVIGHTHQARIAVHDAADGFFALIDGGAWIESCATEDDPTPRPNAQIAALGANEARIYQLAPLT
jgi:UDP-2,3-diacylglucosamine pyrophosphatase LpxH